MKKILLLILISLLFVGCGKKEPTDPIVSLGYKQEGDKYVYQNINLTKVHNEQYNSTDVYMEEVITDKPNYDMFLKTIKLFIDVPDDVVTKGLELLVDAYNDNKGSSVISIFNQEKYYLELYITNEKKVIAVVLTPRVKGRLKDEKFLLSNDLGHDKDYTAARRSKNVLKNATYDEIVAKKVFNVDLPNEALIKISNEALKYCNPEIMCENYFNHSYDLSIYAKNGIYSSFYIFGREFTDLYYSTVHSSNTYKEDIAGDLDIIFKELNIDLSQYKDEIINKIDKKDYKLLEDDNNQGKHHLMKFSLSDKFRMNIDIYEDRIFYDYIVNE